MKGLSDPDNYNWLYHQQLVRGDSEAFFELSSKVEQKERFLQTPSIVLN